MKDLSMAWASKRPYRLLLSLPPGVKPLKDSCVSCRANFDLPEDEQSGIFVNSDSFQLIAYNIKTGEPLLHDGSLEIPFRFEPEFSGKSLPTNTTSGKLSWLLRNETETHFALYYDFNGHGLYPVCYNPPLLGDGDEIRLKEGPMSVGSHSRVAVVDFNGDGVFDLVSGWLGEGISYWENIGSNDEPMFAKRGWILDSEGKNIGSGRAFPQFVDWEGNGLEGILISAADPLHSSYCAGSSLHWYCNDGSNVEPVYRDKGPLQDENGLTLCYAKTVIYEKWPHTKGPIFAGERKMAMQPIPIDIDGDGFLDLAVSVDGFIVVYRNIRSKKGMPCLRGKVRQLWNGENVCFGIPLCTEDGRPISCQGMPIISRGNKGINIIVPDGEGRLLYYISTARQKHGLPLMRFSGEIPLNETGETRLSAIFEHYKAPVGDIAKKVMLTRFDPLYQGRCGLLVGNHHGLIFRLDDIRSSPDEDSPPEFRPKGYLPGLCPPLTPFQGHASLAELKKGKAQLLLGKERGYILLHDMLENTTDCLRIDKGYRVMDSNKPFKVCDDMADEDVCCGIRGVNTDYQPILNSNSYSRPCAVDWNGDGLLDIVVGSDWGYIYYLENTGTGDSGAPRFINRGRIKDKNSNLIRSHTRSGPLAVDWNGTGIPSLIVGGRPGHPAVPDDMFKPGQNKGRNIMVFEAIGRNDDSTPILQGPILLELDGKALEAKWGYFMPVGWADIDGDNRCEIVIFHVADPRRILVLRPIGKFPSEGLTLSREVNLCDFKEKLDWLLNQPSLMDCRLFPLREAGDMVFGSEGGHLNYVSRRFFTQLIDNNFVVADVASSIERFVAFSRQKSVTNIRGGK